MRPVLSALLVIAALLAFTPRSFAVLTVYAGYLNNLSGPPNPADVPAPFDGATYFISSGGANTPHDTGVLRFLNECSVPVTIDDGLNVTTQGAFFQIWDSFLPIVLLPGQDLVLAETANFNFDSSDFGLGMNPVVSGSVDGNAFSFTDTGRVLLGREDAANTPETTPYQAIGRIECASVPDGGSTLALLGIALAGAEGLRRKLAFRRKIR